jgi:4-hydroxybenzoate polyprenyltransferase
MLSTLYYLPPINLRKYGYLKPFLVSLVWVVSCCLVPLIENQMLTMNSLCFIIAQFIFISVLCMLFDIKDMKFDIQSGVSTYANKFGVRFTKVMCLVGMLLFLGFSYMFKADLSIIISNLVLTLVVFIIILITNQHRHPFYYYFWIDGLLIFQTILFFIASFCMI